ncbi:MAG: hypothetical protein MZV70_53560 [Desulfobacterales bacterium]|nr:hypothetical protein [Desulfobacterales bacterium]
MKACADEETDARPGRPWSEMLRPELVKRLQARVPGPAEGGARTIPITDEIMKLHHQARS